MEKTPEQILLEELASPKKSIKVAAIVKAARLSRDPTVLEALQKLASDTDKEIALYSKNAVSRMQLALGQKGQTPAPSGEITAERLLKPKPVDVPGILHEFRKAPDKLPEELRPLMAEFLKKHGGSQDSLILTKWLEESTANLVIPYLEALETRDPQKLVAVLPGYLASPHPYVRSRSIAILNRIDPSEALAHLSELLGSDNSEEKLAGLQIAFSFPFSEVSFLVLTMLSEEADAEVIQVAAILLLSNPDLEIAFRLLELREALPEPRKSMISKLLEQLCKTLVAIGAIDQASATPEALREKFNRERLEKYLADLEVQISLGDPEKVDSIVDWLLQNQGNPLVEAFIAKLGTSPATEEIYRRLAPPPSYVVDIAPAVAVENISIASPEEKLQCLKGLPKEIPDDLITWIRQEAANGEDSVRAAALKTLLTLPPRSEDAAIADAGVGHPNPMVASRAISLLEKLDPKKLIGRIPALLNSPDPFICSRAVLLALRYQEEQARKTLALMLKSDKPNVRAQAVNCLMICPFDKFSPFIFEAIPKETNPNIAKGLLVIVLSNPSPEGLAGLDALPPAANQGIAVLVSQVRTSLFKLLLKLDMITPDRFMDDLSGIPLAKPAPIAPLPPVAPIPVAPVPPPTAELPSLESLTREPAKAPPPKAPGPVPAQKTAPVTTPKPPGPSKAAPQDSGRAEKYVPPPREETPPPAQPKPVPAAQAEAPSPAPVPAEKPSSLPAPATSPLAKQIPAPAAKPYSVAGVRNAIRKREINEKQATGKEKSGAAPSAGPGTWKDQPVVWYGGMAAVAVLISFMLISFGGGDAGGSGGKAKDAPSADGIAEGFRMNVMCRLKGKIVIDEANKATRLSAGGKNFWLEFVTTKPPLSGKEEVEIEMVPFRTLSNGDIKAEVHAIKVN